MDVRELVTILGFDVDEKTLSRFDRGIAATKNSLIAISALTAAAGAAIFGVAKSTADMGDELYTLAPTVGLSVEEFQKYRYALELAGLHQEEFTTGMMFMNRNIGEALKGNTNLQESFGHLGITLQDLKTMSPGDILHKMAGGFAAMTNSSLRAAIAREIFGRSGTKFGFVLGQGTKALEDSGKELEAFGLMSQADADASNDFNDAIIRLKAVLVGIRNEIGIRLFPVIQGTIDRARAWLIANRDIVKQNLTQFVHGLTEALRVAWTVFEALFKTVRNLAKVFGGWKTTLELCLAAITAIVGAQVIMGLVSLVKMLRLINLEQIKMWVTNPYFLIAAAIFVAILAIQDFYTWVKGGQSVFGDLLGPFDKLGEKLERMLAPVKKVFGEIWAALVSEYEETVPAWMRAILEAGGRWLATPASGPGQIVGSPAAAYASAYGGGGMRADPTWGRHGASGTWETKVEVNVTAGEGTSPATAKIIGDSIRPVIREEISKAAGHVLANNPRAEQR